MENITPEQLGVPLVMAIIIAVFVLVWGDRPELAAAVRAWFAPRPTDDEDDEPVEQPRQPPPPARFEVKHFAPYVAAGAGVPAQPQNDGNWRSDAVEQDREQPGTGNGNSVPDPVALLEQLSDDALLDLLARVKLPSGGERFADSRIAKFIGGRVEDRVEQVRVVRAKPAPQPQGRAIPVRERGGAGEHLLTIEH